SPVLSDTSSTLTGPLTRSTIRRVSFSMSAGVIAPSSARIFGFIVTPEQTPHSQYFWISVYLEESTKMATPASFVGRSGRGRDGARRAGGHDRVERPVERLDPHVRGPAGLSVEEGDRLDLPRGDQHGGHHRRPPGRHVDGAVPHPVRSPEVDGPVGGRAQEEPGLGLAALAGADEARIAPDAPGRMVGTVVDGVHAGAVPGEEIDEPLVDRVEA